jgi:hypothetical protein
MLPGDLEAQYSNDPAYQRYRQWSASGGKATWWSQDAAAAAAAAGIPQSVDTTGWTSKTTAWGENVQYDQNGVERSMTNPAWTAFVQSYRPGSDTPETMPMVNQPTSGSTRSVLGADQDQANPWDPTLVRRNQYDVGY